MSLSIIPISLEHRDIETIDDPAILNWTCTSIWWFGIIGFGITFSTLFAKTYRINRIVADSIRCRRIQLTIRETLYPVTITFCFNIVMLSLMTKFGPLVYEIFETKDDPFRRPTETYGNCIYAGALPFLIVILIVNFGMVTLALFQAWRARHLSTEFAESTYIANALIISILVTIFAIPVLFLSQENVNIDTFISTILASVYPGSTLCLIFVPKINFYTKSQKRQSNTRSSTRNSMPPIFRRRNSFESSRISTNSNTSTVSHRSGELILTIKPQRELASEIRSLEKKNANIVAENIELKKRLREFTKSDTGNLNRDDNRDDMIFSDTTFESTNSAKIQSAPSCHEVDGSAKHEDALDDHSKLDNDNIELKKCDS